MSLHILWARGNYIGQVRRIGHRKWETVTGLCRSSESAFARAAAKMKGRHRARVLFIDSTGWYEPNIVIEAKRT